MSDSETAIAVAAAIASLREDDEDMTQAAGGDATNSALPSTDGVDADGNPVAIKSEQPPEVVEKPKPKIKVLSCLICTKEVTDDNTGMGSSNPSDEYERMMRVACKLLCVDSHPLLKRWQFRHSDEPKKLCCDECCEVIFNLGSLQSIIDRTRLAINKKLDWILKTVSDSASEESEEIDKIFFAARSDIFRREVLEVCKRRKNAKNGMLDSDDDEDELVNRGVQTDISGESGVSDVLTKAGLKYYDERPSYSFDTLMDTYSDHNDDMSFNYDDTPKRSSAKKTLVSALKQPAPPARSRGRGTSATTKRSAARIDSDDDEIEILEEKKASKGRGRPPAAKAGRMDARELVKVEYSSESGRPKRSTASKRPNYQALAGDDDDDYPPSNYKRQSNSNSSESLSRSRKPVPTPRKEVTLSAIPIVKDASGKTYFEGVEIVRTDKSITCKHLGCYYVVDGSGYNAFERIKAHIHDSHLGDGSLPDIY